MDKPLHQPICLPVLQGFLVGVSCLLAQKALANPTQTTTLPTEPAATSQENRGLKAQFEDSYKIPELSAVTPSATTSCAKFTPITNAIAPNVSASIEGENTEKLLPPTSFCAADLKGLSNTNFNDQENAPLSSLQEKQFSLSPRQEVAQTDEPDNSSEASPEAPSNTEEVTATEDENSDRWHFKFQPYATIPVTIYGNTTVKGRTVDYHLTTGQLLDLLRVTASGRVEAWKGNLGFIIDGYYASLKGSGIKQFSRFPNASIESTLTFDQGIYDFALSYHFGDAPAYSLPDKPSNKPFPLVWFEPIAGVRLNDINASIEDVNLNLGPFSAQLQKLTKSEGRTWFEPLLGGKFGVQTSDSLTFWMRGDVSGFGIAGDTDLSWNFIAGVDWWVYRNISLQLAYRFYEINYGNGSGNNAFGFEESFNGPFISATLYF
jgi:cytoskeletal protein RodZ